MISVPRCKKIFGEKIEKPQRHGEHEETQRKRIGFNLKKVIFAPLNY